MSHRHKQASVNWGKEIISIHKNRLEVDIGVYFSGDQELEVWCKENISKSDKVTNLCFANNTH